jgi:hypothetical protein
MGQKWNTGNKREYGKSHTKEPSNIQPPSESLFLSAGSQQF